jgi:hypothetical protein
VSEAAAEDRPAVQRGEVWKRLGAPDDQEGSVNDPRTREEGGLSWNEKWIYLEGGAPARVVLWNRYDFLGVFRVGEDGALESEPFERP